MSDANTKLSDKIKSNSIDGKQITDELGRTIRLRKPNILDLYDLMSALDKDADKEICQRMAGNVLYFATIDGQVIQCPKTYGEFRATLLRIGDEGISALATFMRENEEQKSSEEIISKAKK